MGKLPNRVPGHGLREKGAVVDVNGSVQKVGPALCECGANSPVLSTLTGRQIWHRKHKREVLAATRKAEREQPDIDGTTGTAV